MKLIVISYPDNIRNETEGISTLFENGLNYFHLRKPGISKNKLAHFIEKIPTKFHNRIIIYDHFELLAEYKLLGIHFNRRTIKAYNKYKHYNCHKSYSAHTIEELRKYDGLFDYIFISPVYNSISKDGYKSVLDISELRKFLSLNKFASEVVALGGITPDKVRELYEIGFSGIAVLGSVWNVYLENNDFNIALSEFKDFKQRTVSDRPYVLSIAGFDPSCGAGLTADMKTMESLAVYGVSACSAITFQNEDEFTGADWLCKGKIIQQIDILLKRYKIDFVKIGLIENFEVLSEIIDHLLNVKPEIKIVWDPVVKASTGFNFHGNFDEKTFLSVLKKVYLITPNKDEFDHLFEAEINVNSFITQHNTCNILLKGYKNTETEVGDILYDGNEEFYISGEVFHNMEKHGSGCVLSSAITSLLALGNDLRNSCTEAKKYTEQFLLSTNTKLGYHNRT